MGGGLWDYVNVYTLPSHKLQFLALAEARNVANAKKHWLSVWYFVSWNMSYFQLSDSVGLPLAMTHGSWQYNLMGHHHHLVVLTIKECTFYLLTSTTNLWAWHCCTVGLVYLCNAASTTNTRHNWIFYSLFRVFSFRHQSSRIQRQSPAQAPKSWWTLRTLCQRQGHLQAF